MSGRRNHRVFPGISGRRPDQKKRRQEEATARTEARVKRTDADQLDILNHYGFRALKERIKLAKRMADRAALGRARDAYELKLD